MQLTIFTGYGLRSLVYLASRPERLCTIREISNHYGMSYHHMVKITHRLSTLGYIETSKGKGGGVKLANNTRKLRLGDIVTQLEPSIMDPVKCLYHDHNNKLGDCPCQLKDYLNEALRSFIETLNKYTLAEAARNGRVFIAMTDIGVAV